MLTSNTHRKMLMNAEPTNGSSGGGVPPAGPPNAQTPTPPATPADPPQQQATPPAVQQPSGRREQIHTLKDSDFKRVKDEARAKGEKLGAETVLKTLGFSSADEAQKFFAKAKEAMKRPAPGKQPPGQEGQPPPQGPNADRKVRELTQAFDGEKKQRIIAQRRVRELEAKLAATEAQYELRENVILRGASDPDVVVHLVEREAARAASGKAGEELEAALAAFDEDKFLDKLKKDKPYLFSGPEVRPANTGPGPGSAPPPPAPEAVLKQNGALPDAMKMNPQEFAEYMRKLGTGAKPHV